MKPGRLPILSLGDLPTTQAMGGTRRVALELCLALAQRGHQVTAAAPWTNGEELVHDVANLEIQRFGSRRTKSFVGNQVTMAWGAYRAARFSMRQSRTPVILSHHSGACTGTSWASRVLGKQIPSVFMFYASHADEIRTGAHQYERWNSGQLGTLIHPAVSRLKTKQMAWAEAAGLRSASRIVTLSQYAREWAQQLYGIDDSKFTLVPAGVDTQRFCPPQDEIHAVRRRLGLPDKRFILFTLRNLHPRMGVDVLVQAMPEVVARHPDTLLIIGGSGLLLEPLRQMVTKLNLQDHVRLMGRLDEAVLPAYYQAADVFVLPTQSMEGFGMVTLEALACGTPVLGTPIGATPEILSQLGKEFLFDGPGVPALRDGILRMRVELSRRSDIRIQCRRMVEEKYTWAASAAKLEAVLHSAIESTKGSSA